jgi:hypothetical protein
MADWKNIRYVTINRSCNVPQDFRYDNWNCNHCANDSEYYQPFDSTDYLYLQTWFVDNISTNPLLPNAGWYTSNTNGYIRVRLYELNGQLISEDPTDFVVMSCCGSIDNLSFQNLMIDPNTNKLSSYDCFYLEYEVRLTANTSEYFVSEPYKRVNCEETFTIQGQFNGFDSVCNYYDLTEQYATYDYQTNVNHFNFPYAHIDKYRVLGAYELTGTSNTCNLLEDGTMSKVKASTLRNNIYQLITRPIPPYVAEKMLNSATGYSFIIDDCIECICHAGFKKNNDVGTMWHIDTEIEQISSQVNHFNCE